jgi:hypothetical protein
MLCAHACSVQACTHRGPTCINACMHASAGDTSEIQTPYLSAGPSQLQQRSEAAMTPSLNFGPLQTPAEEGEAEETGEQPREAHDSEAPAALEASIPAQITPSIPDFNDSSRFIFEGDR